MFGLAASCAKADGAEAVMVDISTVPASASAFGFIDRSTAHAASLPSLVFKSILISSLPEAANKSLSECRQSFEFTDAISAGTRPQVST
ncbi:hypothetical protein D9M72_477210 [compost metagenome]